MLGWVSRHQEVSAAQKTEAEGRSRGLRGAVATGVSIRGLPGSPSLRGWILSTGDEPHGGATNSKAPALGVGPSLPRPRCVSPGHSQTCPGLRFPTSAAGETAFPTKASGVD